MKNNKSEVAQIRAHATPDVKTKRPPAVGHATGTVIARPSVV